MKSSRGMSLIEMIMAIVVISVALVTIVPLVTHYAKSAIEPQALQVGVSLAEQELEKNISKRFSDVASQASTAFPAPFSAYSYQITVSAVPTALANDPGMNQYKQVQITVTHAAGNYSLSTVISKR